MTDIDAIRKRADAATPGPWGWFGNTDTRDIYLSTRQWGRQFVMQFTRWGMNSATPVFCDGRTWSADPQSGPQSGMDFGESGGMTKAHEMPVYEVAPNATNRLDKGVYRADLAGIRNPDAEFIAAARQDVDDLLAEVDRLRADNQRLRDGIAEVADRREADARVYQATGEAEQAGYHRGMATELRRLAKDRSDTAGVPSEEQRLRAGVREMADEFGTHAVTCNLTGNHDAGQAWEALHDRLYNLLNGDAEAVTR